MKIDVRQIGFFEYLCFYAKVFPVSLSFYGKKVIECEDGGTILLACKDTVPCGMAFACIERRVFTVYFISVRKNFSNEGIELILLDKGLQIAKRLGARSVEYHYSCYKPQMPAYEDILIKKGFEKKCRIISYRIPCSAANAKSWLSFSEKRGNKILQRLNEKGCRLKTLEEVSPEILKKLYSLIGSDFPGELDPGKCEGILTDYSAIALYNNEPVAFCTISSREKGRTITVEQLSSRFDFRNSGVFFLPLSYAVTRAMDSNVDFLMFDVNNKNKIMLKLLSKSLGFTDKSQTDYFIFEYVI